AWSDLASRCAGQGNGTSMADQARRLGASYSAPQNPETVHDYKNLSTESSGYTLGDSWL
ncbi:hypothetical protein FRC12_015551, partial [Ceratobasidium sp. 428]